MTINNSVFIQLRNQMREEQNARTRAMELANERAQDRHDKDMLGVVDTLRTHRLDDAAADKEAYSRGRDTLSDKVEADKTQYLRGRDAQRDAIEADKTQYDRSQDAAKQAFGAEKFAAEQARNKMIDEELLRQNKHSRTYDYLRRKDEQDQSDSKKHYDMGYNGAPVNRSMLNQRQLDNLLLGEAQRRSDEMMEKQKADYNFALRAAGGPGGPNAPEFNQMREMRERAKAVQSAIESRLRTYTELHPKKSKFDRSPDPQEVVDMKEQLRLVMKVQSANSPEEAAEYLRALQTVADIGQPQSGGTGNALGLALDDEDDLE